MFCSLVACTYHCLLRKARPRSVVTGNAVVEIDEQFDIESEMES